MDNVEFSLPKEINERDVMMSVLRQTEGWSKLTERQQQIIKVSLYIQQRAERGTDWASKQAIVSPETHATNVVTIKHKGDLRLTREDGSTVGVEKRKYEQSQNRIVDWNCHAAVASLEGWDLSDDMPSKIDNDFFKAEYQEANNKEELENQISNFDFPCVVHVNLEPNNQDKYVARHSFLVLGRDNEDTLVVWDKQGYRYPYRVTTLDKVYQEYKDDRFWGIRKLRSGDSK